MHSIQRKFQDLLDQGGITINGNKPWDIRINNEQLYNRLLTNVELAVGESYMDNWWSCNRLDEFFFRIFNAKIDYQIFKTPLFWRNTMLQSFLKRMYSLFNFQTKSKATEVDAQHYSIGNDLFKFMLAKRMIYTCAYWKNAETLEEAQEKKLELICQKLQLEPGMKVLDIGCGWGGFAQYAAENYGVMVTGLTISKAQYEVARNLCYDFPVEIRLQDYRDLLQENSIYDRVVSLGMFEHVGYKNHLDYMRIVAHLLKKEGLFLLHTIGSNLSNIMTDRWIDTYIFPNGQLPSIAQIGTSIEGLFVMEDWENFGIYYDKTLMAWHHNFTTHWNELKQVYDDRFRRMWEFYLLSSAASFRARKNQLWQLVLSKNGCKNGYFRPTIN